MLDETKGSVFRGHPGDIYETPDQAVGISESGHSLAHHGPSMSASEAPNAPKRSMDFEDPVLPADLVEDLFSGRVASARSPEILETLEAPASERILYQAPSAERVIYSREPARPLSKTVFAVQP